MNPGDIFQGEGGDYFKQMLSSKADKEALMKCFELKANKVDLHNMLDA